MPEVSDQPAVVLQVCAGEPGGRGAALECLNDAGELAVGDVAVTQMPYDTAYVARTGLGTDCGGGGCLVDGAVAFPGDAADVVATGHRTIYVDA